jgi:hypothetical protein
MLKSSAMPTPKPAKSQRIYAIQKVTLNGRGSGPLKSEPYRSCSYWPACMGPLDAVKQRRQVTASSATSSMRSSILTLTAVSAD